MESINQLPTQLQPHNEKRSKKSTACGPCRKSRKRCDHSIPCSTCKNSNKAAKCLESPPSSLSTFQESIKPNSGFMRVSKPPNPQHRHDSVSTTRPVVQLPSFSVPETVTTTMSPLTATGSPPYVLSSWGTQYGRVTPHEDLEVLREQNLFLSKKVQDLEQQLNAQINHIQQPKLTDLFRVNSDQLDFLRRMIIHTKLPPKPIVDFLVNFFFDNSIDQAHVIHTPTFRLQYEAFWSLVPYQDSIPMIDPLYISLLFAVMAASLIFVPSALIRGSPEYLQFFRNENYANFLHDDWSITTRQLMAAYVNDGDKPDRIVKLQIMSTLKIYLSSTDQFEVLDSFILPQAVMCAYRFKMDCPSSLSDPSLSVLEIELRKRTWWDLCAYDTSRALELGRKPLIQSTLSNIPFPENCDDADLTFTVCESKPSKIQTDTSFLIIQSHITKAMNGAFNIHSTEDANAVFKQLNSIDQQLSLINKSKPDFYKMEGISKNQDNKLAAFQANVIHITICIHRFRLFSSYIPLNLQSSIPQIICQTSIDFLFKKSKYLELLYELDNEPIFLTQLKLVTSALMMQLTAIISGHFKKSSVQQDVKMIVSYLASIDNKQILFVKPKSLSNKVKILVHLKNKMERSSVDLNKVNLNVNALVQDNSSLRELIDFENHDINYKPTMEKLKINMTQLALISDEARWNAVSFQNVLDQISDKPEYIEEVENCHKSYLAVLKRWIEVSS
ncbi:hypothetical protein WICPIJ_007693 [Wickerhamomyces pijperi]|uniref:Zn(2)-C6 fungal-type domain-containing protein n=1 Tax=Wickerhamomyces pijperi TaxID=599730 RepID=A0A9P8Q181_WICPI|nr:hypothetical protein WICPIJ_007693 [Wickerhamomyces pijperi]